MFASWDLLCLLFFGDFLAAFVGFFCWYILVSVEEAEVLFTFVEEGAASTAAPLFSCPRAFFVTAGARDLALALALLALGAARG